MSSPLAKYEINEAALQKVAKEAVKKAAAQVDRDTSSYRGKPVEEVKSALERIMRRHGQGGIAPIASRAAKGSFGMRMVNGELTTLAAWVPRPESTTSLKRPQSTVRHDLR